MIPSLNNNSIINYGSELYAIHFQNNLIKIPSMMIHMFKLWMMMKNEPNLTV